MQGGFANNVIPQQVTLVFDIRPATDVNEDTLEATVSRIKINKLYSRPAYFNKQTNLGKLCHPSVCQSLKIKIYSLK